MAKSDDPTTSDPTPSDTTPSAATPSTAALGADRSATDADAASADAREGDSRAGHEAEDAATPATDETTLAKAEQVGTASASTASASTAAASTAAASTAAASTAAASTGDAVEFLPERSLSPSQLRLALADGDEAERVELVSQLLCYAPWDEIWTYVEPAQVLALWDQLALPDSLRAAWGRRLRVDAQ